MESTSALQTVLPDSAVAALQAFARRQAPADMKWIRDYRLKGPHVTMLEFLLCLREEAMSVLERPDASVPKTKIAFTIEDVSNVYVVALALQQLTETGAVDKDLLTYFQRMPGSLRAIDNFYETRAQRASQKHEELHRQVIDYSMKRLSLADHLQQGALNFNGIAQATVKREDGALDFAAFKDLTRNVKATSKETNDKRADERDRLIDQCVRDRAVRKSITATIQYVHDAMYVGRIPLRGPVLSAPAPAHL